MSKTLNSKILVRRDSSTNWATQNPILSSGEIGLDTDIKKIKIGDGTSHWDELPFIALTTDVTNEVHIGAEAPTDPAAEVWIDTDETDDMETIINELVSRLSIDYTVVNESLILTSPVVNANGRSF